MAMTDLQIIERQKAHTFVTNHVNISGFRHGVNEIFAFLGCYAAQLLRYLPTFGDRFCPETSVNNHQFPLRSIPEMSTSQITARLVVYK